MTNVVIASAARTAVGSFGGAFANTPAHDLGAAVLKELVARAGVDASDVSETILGQVLTAAQGQNPARQAHINAGFPQESAAWGINQVCGSGLRTVALGAGILGLVSGALGSFAVLRKQSLMGDAISHAALPGIVLAFMLTRSKASLVLVLGAAIAGWIGRRRGLSSVR